MEPRPYIRGYDDDLAHVKAKLAETTLLLEVLVKVNSLMEETRSFDEFCLEASRILQEKFGFRYLDIWIIDEKEKTKLRLITTGNSRNPRFMNIFKGVIGKVIREARAICIPDVSKDPDYLNVHPETKSELCIPLMCDGQVIGAINIETDTYQTFDNSTAIIEVIAENLGHTMKHALLYRTEEQFHRLVEHMSEGVWVGDKDEHTLYVNPAYEKMTGHNLESLKGKTSFDFFDEASCEIIRKENEKRKRGIGGHYEAVYLAKNGEKIPVMLHAVPFGDGGTMATFTDLRAIKNAEGKLAKSELFLASITQHCAEAIIGFDEHGIIQTWNVGAERMFGYKTEEMMGKTTEIIIPEDRRLSGELHQIITETKTKGVVRNFETSRIHKNGKPISISLTFSAIRDGKGALMGISGLYRDITAQKKWERELQDRFEKMQDAYREMGKQRRYLDYLVDMIHMAESANYSQKHIATFIVNAIVMIAKVDGASLRLFEKPEDRLILIAQSGLGEDWWSKKTIPYRGSLLEKAVAQGYPLKILDILNDSQYPSPALARKNNLRSALVIPLQAKGELLGSLVLYLSQENSLSLLDDEFIGIFAKQSSLALRLAI